MSIPWTFREPGLTQAQLCPSPLLYLRSNLPFFHDRRTTFEPRLARRPHDHTFFMAAAPVSECRPSSDREPRLAPLGNGFPWPTRPISPSARGISVGEAGQGPPLSLDSPAAPTITLFSWPPRPFPSAARAASVSLDSPSVPLRGFPWARGRGRSRTAFEPRLAPLSLDSPAAPMVTFFMAATPVSECRPGSVREPRLAPRGHTFSMADTPDFACPPRQRP